MQLTRKTDNVNAFFNPVHSAKFREPVPHYVPFFIRTLEWPLPCWTIHLFIPVTIKQKLQIPKLSVSLPNAGDMEID